MVVQHNLTAMNSNRMLGITTNAQAKSSEKLSSGYKINRAADDAAGLSISEKMRRQIRGLTQASSNAEDGISSVQTAEGALNEVHDMLQRMDELATKAANGTMSEDDRQNVQDEIDQLLTEVDRVSETTKFNETYLLKGNTDGTKSDKLINAHDAGLAGKLVDNGKTATFTLDKALENGDTIKIAGKDYTIGDGSGAASETKYAKTDDATLAATKMKAGDSITDASDGKTYTLVDKLANEAANLKAGMKFTVTSSNGTETKYKIAASTAHASAADTGKDPQELSVNDASVIFATELEAGSTITMTADKDGKAVNVQLVDSLDDGSVSGNKEVSTIKADGSDLNGVITVNDFKGATYADVTLAEGDTVSIGGEDTVLTAAKPADRDKVNAIIDAMGIGDSVKVTSVKADGVTPATAQEYVISEKTNEAANEYTAEDLKSIINNLDEVQFKTTAENSKALALINDTTGDSYAGGATFNTTQVTVTDKAAESDSDVISVSQAYSKIKDELAKASSIGTDEGKEATVSSSGDGSFTITKGTAEIKDSLAFNLHVGADADMTNKITVNIDTMDTAGLGIKGLNVKDNSGTAATYAIDSIEDAIKKVSEQRSALGAVQNRLEHTIKNLDNVVENTTSAESAIRDTDMASEMVKYSNNNILMQAGQSMLAQANQSNQGVLSLLG